MANQQKEFGNLFFDREFIALSGKSHFVTKLLVGLLCLTLVSLGFAVGGLKQLDKRMNNPFSKWVDLEVSSAVDKKMDVLRPFYNNPDTAKLYQLEDTKEWSKYFMTFHHGNRNPILDRPDTLAYIRKGRTVDFGSDLFLEIIREHSPNLLYLREGMVDEMGSAHPCGVIVTEALMGKLGYSKKDYPMVHRLSVSLNQHKDVVFIDLIGVVKQLPSLCHFVSSERLYSIAQGTFRHYIEGNSKNDTTTVRLMSSMPVEKEKIELRIEEGLGVSNYDIEEGYFKIDENKGIYSHIVHISPSEAPNSEKYTAFLKGVTGDNIFSEYSYIDCGEDSERLDNPDHLMFNFESFTGIRPFQQALYRNFDIELEMEQVESRENFQIVSRLTFIIGLVLFGFGLLSILFFISNLIRTHINKIKGNLGTFKAMGLSDTFLVGVYSKVVFKIFGIAALFAIPIALIVGNLFGKLIGLQFSLWHWSILISTLIMGGVIYFLVQNILNRVLRSTPGDLIYNR